jgi:hypothetical protein
MMAMVVTSVVILIIANVSIRVQGSSIATTQYRASKVNQIDLVGLMDRDFRNIGATYPNYVLDPASAIIMFSGDSTGGVFAFWTQTERGMPPDSVRYEWAQTGTVRIDTAYVPAYSVTRQVNGDATGGSAGAVTTFDLRLLNADGNPTGVLSDTRQIEVNVSVISSLGSSDLVEMNDWQTIIRPAALVR